MTSTTNTVGSTNADEMENALYSLVDKINALVVREQLNLPDELA